MIVTTIKFVGLLVTTMLAPPNHGVQLIMGNFPVSDPPHLRLIAWPKNTRIMLEPPEINWPKAGEFKAPDGVDYEYALVALQNVFITGPDEPFNLAMDKIPHLTCCCLPFKAGFNPQWGDPAYTGPDPRMSAFFTFTHGTYTTFPEKTDAISTALGITDNVAITFEGIFGGVVQKIRVQPPQPPTGNYILYVANTPLAVLEGQPVHSPDTNDFQNYYLMGIGTTACTGSPSQLPPNPCAPSDKGCETKQSARLKVDKAKTSKIVAQVRKALKPVSMMVNADCSSSQWP